MSVFRRNSRIAHKNIFLQKSEESTREATRNLSFTRRRRRRSKERACRSLLWLGQILLAVLLAFFLTFSFGRGITISGSSMEPSLYAGDLALVNRLVYHVRRPKAGDLLVFRPANKKNASYTVKRLVAGPGDLVYISAGKLYVNGSVFRRAGVSFTGIQYAGNLAKKTQLQEDQYLVMGDNFNNSEDSRYASIGFLSGRDLVGKAWFDISRDHFGPLS